MKPKSHLDFIISGFDTAPMHTQGGGGGCGGLHAHFLGVAPRHTGDWQMAAESHLQSSNFHAHGASSALTRPRTEGPIDDNNNNGLGRGHNCELERARAGQWART